MARAARADEGYGPAQGYNPDPGGYAPAQGYEAGPDYGPAQGYNTAQGYGPAAGYALAQDYEPEPAYPPAQGQPGHRGNRRLYAVPDDAEAVGFVRQQPDSWDGGSVVDGPWDQNLESPGALATMPAPAVAPPRPRTRPNAPAGRPVRPAGPRTRPNAPAGRPTRSAGMAGPRTTPTGKTPTTRGRQAKAMRIAAAATAALFSVAIITGASELVLHGYKFFIFRETGVGESGPNAPTDQQEVAQQAAAAHHAATPNK